MFKPFVFGTIIAAVVALGACTQNGTTIDFAAVAAAVKSTCAFSPVIADIVKIETDNPQITKQIDLVNLICAAVNATNAPKTGAHLDLAEVTVVVNGKTYVVHEN